MEALNPADYTLIERFLDNTLSDAELRVFNDKLTNEPKFKEAFEAYKEAILAVQIAGEDEVRAVLKQIHVRHMASEKVIKMQPVAAAPNELKILRGWIVAASIALIFTIGGVYWYYISSDIENLDAHTALNTQLWQLNTRDRSGTQDDITFNRAENLVARFGKIEGEQLVKGIQAFQKKEYSQAAQYFETVNITNDTFFLYKAHAYIENKNYKAAITVLNQINSNSAVYKQSEWYSGVAHYKAGEKEEATAIFKRIAANDKTPWQTKAKKFLKALKVE